MILFQLKSPSGLTAAVGICSETENPTDANRWDVITFKKDGKMITTFGRFYPFPDFFKDRDSLY